jgi:putative hydrolase of the HAD superfamily
MTSVLLDVGGVVVLPDFTPVADALTANGGGAHSELLDRAHYLAVNALDQAYLTESQGLVDAYVAGFISALGRDDRELAHAIEESFTSPWSRTIEESVEAIRSLNGSVHRVVLVSNSLGHVEQRLRGICQVGPGPGAMVDAVVDSHHVGVEKPDPRIFELALSLVDGKPEDALHVGDSIAYDVDGAQAAGIRAIHFDPWGTCVFDTHEHISSLADSPSWLH